MENVVYSVLDDEGQLCGIFSTEAKARSLVKRLASTYCLYTIHKDTVDLLENDVIWRVIYYLNSKAIEVVKQSSLVNLEEISVWYYPNEDVEFIWTYVNAPKIGEAKKLGKIVIDKFLEKLGDKTPLNYKSLIYNDLVSHHETHDSYF